MRKFEIVSKYKDAGLEMPVRKTSYAAGYDVAAAEDVIIPKYSIGIKPTLVSTGMKVVMGEDEYLMLVNRSSGPKKGLVLANGIAIIDHDYYNNESNEGEIMFQYFNVMDHDIEIKKGDIIGQFIFQKFLLTDDDKPLNVVRTGGFGSTDKK